MLTKTNIYSVQKYLGGNTDCQKFENDKQNVDVAPLENFLWTPVDDRTFAFSYFIASTHYELFVSFRSLNFGCKINRYNPLLVLIS